MEEIIKTLRISVKSDFFDANVTHAQRHKTMKTPIKLGFGPEAEISGDKEDGKEEAA
ncbi:MAG: hypothetical protein LRZ85_07920 [Alphaproteobacteria bacterium]|nr:hypothetical protein [Alphaproteobacteria bacterium]